MPGIWIYSEDSAVARQLLTAGQELKQTMQQPLNVITLYADDAQSFVQAGADKVCVLKGNNPWPESYAAAITTILAEEQASVLLVGASMRGKDLAAKVAAGLKAGLVTDALSIQYANEAIETTRLMYGGLAVRSEAVSLPALVTIPPRTFAEAPNSAGQGEVVTVEVANDDTKVTINNVCPIVRQGA
ncbi:MAG: fixB, partial [Sporomusa sp.]|nr:fixB [Sporomusa sp.]